MAAARAARARAEDNRPAIVLKHRRELLRGRPWLLVDENDQRPLPEMIAVGMLGRAEDIGRPWAAGEGSGGRRADEPGRIARLDQPGAIGALRAGSRSALRRLRFRRPGEQPRAIRGAGGSGLFA